MKWNNTADKKPDQGMECVLLAPGGNVYGPIAWMPTIVDGGAWVDLFATAEAGTMITPDQVAKWLPWDSIKPDDETGNGKE